MTGSDRRLGALSELGTRIAAAAGFEDVVDVTLLGLDELLGHRHSLLLVHQIETDRLVTLASRGYESSGIGSEVVLGEGVIGMAGAQRGAIRVGNLQRMLRYALSARGAASGDGGTPKSEIRLPGLPHPRSQLAAPMIARGALVGVVAVESEAALAFDDIDEQTLALLAHLVGACLDRDQGVGSDTDVVPLPERPPDASPRGLPESSGHTSDSQMRLRHYVADGSTFIDDAYVIKGVAGRLLWKVATEYVTTGRTAFTTREARLDPALELPAFRDNFDSRLILLKRRLEEHCAPLRITSTGRGRFEFRADTPVVLERVEPV